MVYGVIYRCPMSYDIRSREEGLLHVPLLYTVFVCGKDICTYNSGCSCTFVIERYNCVKYKNSPDYKRICLLDTLPIPVKNSANILLTLKNI